MSKSIVIKGAREHNLQNINLKIPRDKLVVITGLSGSGKSSLAFDTIYAEGQRRYVESLSSYARQFLERMDKPDVDHIEGLSPSIAIEQKSASKNPRSTVGTVTEIYDYLRLLYARAGKVNCKNCGKPISSMTASQMRDVILKLPSKSKIELLSPIIRGKKGEFKIALDNIRAKGFVRARINGQLHDLGDDITLDKNRKHNIEIVVDRLKLSDKIHERLQDSIELALKTSGGTLILVSDTNETVFSEQFSCPDCEISYPEIEPRMFSFNSPSGACSSCSGLGSLYLVSEDLVVADPSLSISKGALKPFSKTSSNYIYSMINSLATHYKFSVTKPFKKLSQKVKSTIFYGSPDQIKFNIKGKRMSHSYKDKFEGVITILTRRYNETGSQLIRDEIEKYMRIEKCASCNGARLKEESLNVIIGDKNILEFTQLSIETALDFISNLKLSDKQFQIAEGIIKEIRHRLEFLNNVGLSYLTLDRAAATLSGGESQRIRLATQIGSALMGVLYVLDEPSIGLHQKDNQKLIKTLLAMRNLGNTVLVVEHDKETILASDYLIDLGPGAGVHGGNVIYAGPTGKVANAKKSITGQYLSGKKNILLPSNRRALNSRYVTIQDATANNLKSINVTIPIGLLTVITGVSGSGKSTLMRDILYKGLGRYFFNSKDEPGSHKAILGLENIDKVINIDQNPIGRTPRSNPATYTQVFGHIRELFATLPDSKRLGYKAGRFSFNVKGGRCEACQGDGVVKIDMNFLPDIFVKCDICNGKRFSPTTLNIRYNGKNIAEILEMTVEEGLLFFRSHPKIKKILTTLNDVGLEYIKLGQNATTLSGGEAQRIKLSRELAKRATGRTLYLLDEPTTGLHFEDIKKLLVTINRLVDSGNTVLIIEHNLDVIKTADYIIDLGPEGGDKGGEIVASGTPEEVAKSKMSHTGKALLDEFRYLKKLKK